MKPCAGYSGLSSTPRVPTKIGVLDSGVGGLSVLQHIHRLLPDIPTLYFADQGHVPYGPRPKHEIDTYVTAIARFLMGQGARVIVVACHAASAASLYHLRAAYPNVPFVGIEPAVKPAAAATRSGVIGVLTTQATAEGQLYRRVIERFAADVRVLTRVAPDLVDIVEQGQQHTSAGREALRRHVMALTGSGADQIVLACTHFPFLADEIRALAGPGVALVDPGPAVARRVAQVLPRSGTNNGAAVPYPEPHRYFTSGDATRFGELLALLLGETGPVTGVEWLPASGDYGMLTP